jgi:amino acid transporter
VRDEGLRRALGVVETAGVSVAMMAPTMAMAMNNALAAAYAGPGVPLAFVLAFVTIGCVAFAFVTFARVYASPASVGEFNTRGLGPFAGRLSAWALLLVYVLFAAGASALFGSFTAADLAYAGIAIAWAPLALMCLALAAYVGTRPARTSSRAMLLVEGVSVLAIVVLSVVILVRGGAHGVSFAPFVPRGTAIGGLGLATVFALMSFGGFEGAAVLGAESVAPTRTIPRALVASVALAGVLYVFVAYAQTIGFGIDARGVAAFAGSASPLGDLATRYANAPVAMFVTAGAAISSFAAALAPATGAARLVYALALDGRVPARFARIDPASGTPAYAYRAVLATCAVLLIAFVSAGASAGDAYTASGSVAVLALVIVYGVVQVSALRLFVTRWTLAQRAVPIVALGSLAATFVANVIPVPHGAAALYPYVVFVWLALGAFVLRSRAPAAASIAEVEV